MNTIINYFTNRSYFSHLGAFNQLGTPTITPAGDNTNGYDVIADGVSDICGTLEITRVGTPIVGEVLTITFNKPYTRRPLVFLSYNDILSPGTFYVTSTADELTIFATAALTVDEPYTIGFLCFEGLL